MDKWRNCSDATVVMVKLIVMHRRCLETHHFIHIVHYINVAHETNHEVVVGEEKRRKIEVRVMETELGRKYQNILSET